MSYFIGIDLKEYKDKLDSIELNTDLERVNSHHVTVLFLGKIKEYRLKRIMGRLQAFDYDKFTLNLDSLYAFSDGERDRFLALSFEDRKPIFNLLFSLIEYLEEMPTGGTGLQHVTLYRTKESSDLVEMERKIIEKIKNPFEVEVKDIVLYRSNSSESGKLNDYEEILRVPFS